MDHHLQNKNKERINVKVKIFLSVLTPFQISLVPIWKCMLLSHAFGNRAYVNIPAFSVTCKGEPSPDMLCSLTYAKNVTTTEFFTVELDF